jgi:hypothetical protein
LQGQEIKRTAMRLLTPKSSATNTPRRTLKALAD